MISRQCKLDLLARFMEINSVEPKLRQDQIAKELGCSSSTLQRYKNDINKLPSCGIPPNNTNKWRQKISDSNLDDDSHRERDVKRPQINSKGLK